MTGFLEKRKSDMKVIENNKWYQKLTGTTKAKKQEVKLELDPEKRAKLNELLKSNLKSDILKMTVKTALSGVKCLDPRRENNVVPQTKIQQQMDYFYTPYCEQLHIEDRMNFDDNKYHYVTEKPYPHDFKY